VVKARKRKNKSNKQHANGEVTG